MNRRSLLAKLAALPFMGALLPAAAGATEAPSIPDLAPLAPGATRRVHIAIELDMTEPGWQALQRVDREFLGDMTQDLMDQFPSKMIAARAHVTDGTGGRVALPNGSLSLGVHRFPSVEEARVWRRLPVADRFRFTAG